MPDDTMSAASDGPAGGEHAAAMVPVEGDSARAGQPLTAGPPTAAAG